MMMIDNHAPCKSIRASERFCPWINTNLKTLMQSRNKVKRAAIKNNSALLMSSYRHIRNKINKQKTELRKQYFSERISQAKGNMKES